MTTTLAIVLTATFTLLGTAKLAALPAMRTAATHLGYTTEQYRLIGALELTGAAGITIGSTLPGIGIAAAAGLILLMLGATRAHIKNHDTPTHIIVPITVAAIAAAYLITLR